MEALDADTNQLFPDASQLVELPAIDMSPSCDADGDVREARIVAGIMEMCTTLGFFQLKNVPGFDENELLSDIKEFHALPDDVKRTITLKHYNSENSNIYRGFIPFIDNDPSHKEMFDMGCDYSKLSEEEKKHSPLVEETPFPNDSQFAHIRKNYEKHYDFRLRLGLELLEYLAVGLGKDRHFFRDWFGDEGTMSTFRSIKYLPRSLSTVKAAQLVGTDQYQLTTPEHTDSDLITMLSTFGFPGLQIPIDGVYKFVKPEPNNIVVNLGDLFAYVTSFKLKSTKHRVMDIGCERFSSPFFFAPKASAPIPSTGVVPGTQPEGIEEQKENDGVDGVAGANDQGEQMKPASIVYGKWIARHIQRFGEWKDVDLTWDGDTTGSSQ